jgi:hypothetical protein
MASCERGRMGVESRELKVEGRWAFGALGAWRGNHARSKPASHSRIHSTLRVTPALEAGLTDHVWTIEDMIEKIGQ